LSSASFFISVNTSFGTSTTTGLEEAIGILGSIKPGLTVGRFDAFAHRVEGESYPPANIVGVSSHFWRLENGNSGGDSDRNGDYGT
jgi:hypothetical protein